MDLHHHLKWEETTLGQDFFLQMLVFIYDLRRKGEAGPLGFSRKQECKGLGSFIFGPVFPVRGPSLLSSLCASCRGPGDERGRDSQWPNVGVSLRWPLGPLGPALGSLSVVAGWTP